MNWRVVALVVPLFAAACTSESEPTPTTVSTTVVPSPSSTSGQTTTTTLPPRVAPTSHAETCGQHTLEDLQACWARNRQQVIHYLTDGIEHDGWGVTDNVLRGPGGMKIDLEGCPNDWSDNGGINDESIRLVMVSPLSGNLGRGNWDPGLQVYLDYINLNGGVGGRQVELEVFDDGYQSSITQEIVDHVLSNSPPFAVMTYGSPNTMTVADALNDACVPMPFPLTGHSAMGDVERFPWIVTDHFNYRTEALMWLDWIEHNYADRLPVNVAALQMENFGQMYAAAFAEAAATRPDVVADFTAVTHADRAPDVDEQMAQIISLDPDIYIQMTAGNPCLLGLQTAMESGFLDRLEEKSGTFINPSVCTEPNSYLAPAGEASDGVVAMKGHGISIFSTRLLDALPAGVFEEWVTASLSETGFDPMFGPDRFGFGMVGWPLVESLLIAEALPGGLTRTNFLLAQRTLDLDHPALPDGIAYRANGHTDPHLIEGTEIVSYNAATKTWETLETIDLDGQTGPCTWEGPTSGLANYNSTVPLDDAARNELSAPCTGLEP